ncbi:zinc finger protein 511 [Dorcoceras hygrometricum]|uniref:Zinc finger protein 511 n=1 Tax=Dorcoceras hygrometricum TaxID=472368 RepID=A0A2Z7AEX4_9LAMI|nr:zinc finger protein 511 [Dorcoceras hygrometricum]
MKGGEMGMEVEGSGAGFEFPFWKPLRRSFGPDFPFFEAGNLERELLAKQVALELTDSEKQQIRNLEDGGNSEVFCPIVGCGAHLKSLEEFEDHYNARHRASCSVCSKVFPTSRLLSIHVSESHDSFFQAKVARGFAMYECLVEGCGAKLMHYKSRQQHLIDKHKFPASFEFKKANPSRRHRQKLLHKKGSDDASSAPNMQVDEDSMDTLVSAVSRLSTSDSPSSISFGRRHTRGFAFVPRAVERERRPPSRSHAQTK